MIMQMQIQLRKAVALKIGALNQPAVTYYEIAVIIFKLYQAGFYKGQKLAQIRKSRASRSDCTHNINNLLENGVLEEGKSARHPEVFSILGMDQGSPNEIVCSIDPFAYISYLSAMEWHRLTDRIGQILFYSSLAPRKWQTFAREKTQKDIGIDQYENYLVDKLPRLKRLNFKKIGKYNIHRYLSDHLGAFTSVQGRCLRVSTIGRTFLDMLRETDSCGGIYHVLDVFEEHGPRYIKLIIDEIDRHGTKIDKVRAGYILDECMDVSDPRVKNWQKFAQREGSRKFHAKSSYSNEFSETWCLSINIER